VPPRETRELYHSQSPWGLEANREAGKRPELRAEEKALIEEQMKSPELRPLVCLVEARGLGLMRSAREGDELCTGMNMRALLSAIASGREEIKRIGRRHGWSVGVREEILDGLQAMVREPIQRGGDVIMSSVPHTWREQAKRRVSKAEGVIEQMTSAITTEDWSLQHCHDYLVELEMVTSGALMALKADRERYKQRAGQSAGGVPGVQGPEGQGHGPGAEAEAPRCEAAGQRQTSQYVPRGNGRNVWSRPWQLERVQRSSVLRPVRRPEGVQEKLG
jgi:hypothetical protein